jgi:DNA-binding transcriptional regulator YhcF (GntR family)
MKELPKTEIVFSTIKDKITKGELLKGDKLSPVLTLANEFGVSTFTIIRAFKLLEKESLITRVIKVGVYVGAKTQKRPISLKKIPAKTRAQEIAESITSQIIQGTLKAGDPLTLKKALAFKYAASKRTIKKAIEILIGGRYIHKDEFRYIIGQPTVTTIRSAKNRVYILTEPEPLGWKFLDPYSISFFLPFEQELQKHGINSFEYLNFWNEPDLINKVKEADTAGFLIDFRYLNLGSGRDKDFQSRFYKTAEIISKKNLPVIIDNYNSILYQIPDFTFKRMSNLFFIGHDDYEAGEKAGTYLASMGHKQIAYFCFGNYPGNLQKFNGVESAMKKLCGGESKIHYFHEDSDAWAWRADSSTYKILSKEDKTCFLEGYSKLFTGYQFKMDDPIVEMYPLLANHIKKDLCIKRMSPLFEKALKIKEITAWVGTGADDTIAAAEFLIEHKINIPNEINLIGFGNIGDTAEYGITVFDFMESKAGYLAAHCILGDIPIKKNRKGYVEYEGQIMVRKSVKAV